MTDLRAPDGTLLFSHNELACRSTGVVQLAPGFGDLLAELRLKWARPMIVNSCCRSFEHNAKPQSEGGAGGHRNSLHVYDTPHWPTGGTCAIDFKVRDGQEAGELAFFAYSLGWSVGVPKSGFVHLDRREIGGLKPKALFGYGG